MVSRPYGPLGGVQSFLLTVLSWFYTNMFMFTHMWGVGGEEIYLWHPAPGSAVLVDEEVHPAAKQEPIQRIGESQAVE